MRRSLVAFVVMAVTLLSVAAPASAATGQVTHIRASGISAEADWFSATATSFTEAAVLVVKTKQGPELFADVAILKLKNGKLVGATITGLRGPGGKDFVTSGFAWAIAAPKLASASVSGSGLPARTCTIDAQGNQTGCKRSTLSLDVRWTGHGPITRTVANFRMKRAGFSMRSHSVGTTRAATATGTIAGQTLTARQLEVAELSIAKSIEITRCIGNAC
jgi:hypothetical protein